MKEDQTYELSVWLKKSGHKQEKKRGQEKLIQIKAEIDMWGKQTTEQ